MFLSAAIKMRMRNKAYGIIPIPSSVAFLGSMVCCLLTVVFATPARAETYGYDATGRLLNESVSSAVSDGFVYDDEGNITQAISRRSSIAEVGQLVRLEVSGVARRDPPSTGITAFANTSALGGAASVALNDNGTAGDSTAGDGVFSVEIQVAAGTPTGILLVPVTFTDAQGRTWQEVITVEVSYASDIPTLPQWGLIILACVLVAMAVRSLPRSMEPAAPLLLAFLIAAVTIDSTHDAENTGWPPAVAATFTLSKTADLFNAQ